MGQGWVGVSKNDKKMGHPLWMFPNGTISAEEFRSFMKKQDEDNSDIEIV